MTSPDPTGELKVQLDFFQLITNAPWPDVSDPELVRHLLHDLGLPADPPHVARARDPTYDDAA